MAELICRDDNGEIFRIGWTYGNRWRGGESVHVGNDVSEELDLRTVISSVTDDNGNVLLHVSIEQATLSTADIIDSREIIERIETLESWRDDPTIGLDEDEARELSALRALAEEAEGYAEDWRYGVTLIRDDYFENYARDLAVDTGAIKNDVSWPYTCIDWEQAAAELQTDYTSVTFDGETYWVR